MLRRIFDKHNRRVYFNRIPGKRHCYNDLFLTLTKKEKKKEREGDTLYVTVDSTISVILCLQEETFQLHHIGYIG